MAQRSKPDGYDVLVVGAGYAGAVMAERIASELGRRVLVIDRRPHVAGNAFDYRDEHGILIHRYGPHLFHTNSEAVFEYLSRFTDWTPYEHRVLSSVDGQLLPIPINRDTVNRYYGLDLKDDEETEAFFAARAEKIPFKRTSEDAVLARVGRDLYEAFFRGYTRKQWGVEPSELAASVTSRIPVRTNRDDRYFTDRFQALPSEGYTRMFERMLDHPGIEVRIGTDFEQTRDEVAYDQLVYTGPIDAYFGHRFGPLPYRSLRFELATFDTPDRGFLLPVTQLNFPNDYPWTRITEFRHLYRQPLTRSTIAAEFPEAEGEPFYPVPAAENRRLYERYEALARATPDVTFTGRLARYQYLNMDQVVAQALATFERLKDSPALRAGAPRTARYPSPLLRP